MDDVNILNGSTLLLVKSTNNTCECGVTLFKKALTQITGLDHIFKPTQVRDLPKKFTISEAGNTRGSNE
jgi:hypothetical protein